MTKSFSTQSGSTITLENDRVTLQIVSEVPTNVEWSLKNPYFNS